MALETLSYVNGREYSAAAIRRDVYGACRGNTSIVEPGAFRVTATVPPSGKLLVYPGSAELVSPHASGEAYRVRNNAALEITPPANTGSSPVTRFVQVAVRDPEQAGMPAQSGSSDPLVDMNTGTALLTDRPVLPCARLVIPAQTGTFTDAMLTDIRPFPNARQVTDQVMRFPASTVNMATAAYQSWPLSDFAVDVPPWATNLIATATINGASWTGNDLGRAGVRLIFANNAAQNGIITSPAGQAGARQTVAVMGEWAVPANLRGGIAYLGIQGQRTAGTGHFTQDYQSQVTLAWTFREGRV